jgi:CDP-glucose 4,6-dehydratase
VFVTGHTGFKGSWLALWLARLGARVTGYALAPASAPALFTLARIDELTEGSDLGDVCDLPRLQSAMRAAAPEIVFHLAAQSLVRASYRDPVTTYASNVMGTVHLLEAVRHVPSVRAVVIVTSDKCYENVGRGRAFVEDDPMGGFDPYSSSKGCAELVSAAYRRSFFAAPESPGVATARAGNVIGGGDWAEDRLVPDLVRSWCDDRATLIRYPAATRPWQHVLEPLGGYLLLAERLVADPARHATGWNFGPALDDVQPVATVADRLVAGLGAGAAWRREAAPARTRLRCSRSTGRARARGSAGRHGGRWPRRSIAPQRGTARGATTLAPTRSAAPARPTSTPTRPPRPSRRRRARTLAPRTRTRRPAHLPIRSHTRIPSHDRIDPRRAP